MKIPETFVALDLETTGLDFEKDEIIEVALVRFVEGQVQESCDFLVKPVQNLRPFIEHLTGIESALLENAPDFPTIAEKIYSFIGDAPIVAHNAQFDFHFLKNAFAKVGVVFDNHLVYDSLTLSRIAFQNVPNHKLETLLNHLNIKRSTAHRALPDAEACGELFVKSIEQIKMFPKVVLEMCQWLAEGTLWESIFEKTDGFPEWQYEIKEEGVVAPLLPRKVPFRVSSLFSKEGKLAKKIENYVERSEQIDFASIVERNMHKGGLAVLEAGTGIGKSFAYLTSAALRAVSSERVIVSTATKTLQEQLYNHEVPVLQSILGEDLRVAVLKGRSNYICLRKFEEIRKNFKTLLNDDEKETFMTLLPWLFTTTTGDISQNTGFNHLRNRNLWNKLFSDASTCSGEKCPFYSKCPALAAKKKAMAANLLLVNHSLFLSDLLLDFAILPSYDHVIFDEAHRLPSYTAQAFSRSFRFFDLRNVCKLLHGNSSKGLLALAESVLENSTEIDNLRNDILESEKLLHRFLMKIGKRLSKQKQNSLNYKNGILADYEVNPKPFLERMLQFKLNLESVANLLRNDSNENGLARDFEGVASTLSRMISDFEFIVQGNRDRWAFYLEEPYNPHTIRLNAKPLDPGFYWQEKFYSWIKSATFTSATLSIKGSLDYFVSKMGMQKVPVSKKPFLKIYSQTLSLEGQQVVIADYLPKPNAPEYQEALENLFVELLPKLSENTMVLFTSLHAMTLAYQKLSPVFSKAGKLLLCQNVDGSLENLTEIFRKSRGACLLGCQVLWEGIDLPGDALKNLIIPKLPFPNPSDSYISAKVDYMKSAGQNVFKELFVPEAFLGLRQGMGRLIRSENDSGTILLLDNRVLTENYGKTFQKIWSEKHTIVSSYEKTLEYFQKSH